MRLPRLALALAFGLAALSSPSARAADPGVLMAGAGIFDILPLDQSAGAVHLQYRFAPGLGAQPSNLAGARFLGFKPLVGGMVNADEASMLFAGVAMPFAWDNGWELEGSVGGGLYTQNDSTDLGGKSQFHVGLGVSKRVGEHLRLGVAMTHISNAQLHRRNPGTNILLATVGWEFGGS